MIASQQRKRPKSFRAEEPLVEWHIVTGEYPPQRGGVSDYTFQVCQEFVKDGDRVHVWAPDTHLEGFQQDLAQVHTLPGGFGWRWLRGLDRRLKSYTGPRNILIQYVPHMYGWKSMNLAFCWWIFRQRKQNVCVMFHEVAFPFRSGQPLRHGLLAIVHRFMAWAILRSVRHSFTSTERYMALLRKLGNNRSPISLLRICSNIPPESYESPGLAAGYGDIGRGLFTLGIFSNFAGELCEVLEPVIECLLQNPRMEVLLLGPGEQFHQSLAQKYPLLADRIRTTGRLHVTEIPEHMRRCGALLQIYPEGASAARGTLIGALASGIPVVTTAGPATDRLLLESDAMLFPDRSPHSIRDAVELLSENPALARQLAARAERLYQESFQPTVIISKIKTTMVSASHKELMDPELCAGNSRD
jgi:glycosyltransferase involved in cell wall biosynthesis